MTAKLTIADVRTFNPETGSVRSAFNNYSTNLDNTRDYAQQLARTAPEV